MNFYIDIVNDIYLKTTNINDTYFSDPFEFLEIKHTEAKFKGKVFYENIITELVKHWRAKTPIRAGEHFSDDCTSLVKYCKEKIVEINSNDIFKNVDIKYQLDIDFPKDGLYKSLYDSLKRQIEKHGFFQIKDDNSTVNVYHPGLAVILSSQEIPVYDSKSQGLNIHGWKFLDDYVNGYKDGINYFDNNFAIDQNVLYGPNAEHYIRSIHKNYFYENHEGSIGWHFVKNSYPFTLTHKTMHDFGYYSGIVSKVDEMVKKHTSLFYEFESRIEQSVIIEKQRKSDPNTFDELFFKSQDAEHCLNILRELQKPAIDSNNNYIGKNKGIFPLWINILKSNRPAIIKHQKDLIYKDILNSKIKGLNLSKDASEFRKEYKRLINNKIDSDIKTILSQLSQSGKLGK